jgi:hypothetical protein
MVVVKDCSKDLKVIYNTPGKLHFQGINSPDHTVRRVLGGSFRGRTFDSLARAGGPGPVRAGLNALQVTQVLISGDL